MSRRCAFAIAATSLRVAIRRMPSTRTKVRYSPRLVTSASSCVVSTWQNDESGCRRASDSEASRRPIMVALRGSGRGTSFGKELPPRPRERWVAAGCGGRCRSSRGFACCVAAPGREEIGVDVVTVLEETAARQQPDAGEGAESLLVGGRREGEQCGGEIAGRIRAEQLGGGDSPLVKRLVSAPRGSGAGIAAG